MSTRRADPVTREGGTKRWTSHELLDLVLDEGTFASWDEPIDLSYADGDIWDWAVPWSEWQAMSALSKDSPPSGIPVTAPVTPSGAPTPSGTPTSTSTSTSTAAPTTAGR